MTSASSGASSGTETIWNLSCSAEHSWRQIGSLS